MKYIISMIIIYFFIKFNFDLTFRVLYCILFANAAIKNCATEIERSYMPKMYCALRDFQNANNTIQ